MHPIQRDIILDASNVYHTIRNLLICRFFERFVASAVDWYSVIEVQYSIADVVLKPTPQNIQLLME